MDDCASRAGLGYVNFGKKDRKFDEKRGFDASQDNRGF
jgi:hypothetical protein